MSTPYKRLNSSARDTPPYTEGARPERQAAMRSIPIDVSSAIDAVGQPGCLRASWDLLYARGDRFWPCRAFPLTRTDQPVHVPPRWKRSAVNVPVRHGGWKNNITHHAFCGQERSKTTVLVLARLRSPRRHIPLLFLMQMTEASVAQTRRVDVSYPIRSRASGDCEVARRSWR